MIASLKTLTANMYHNVSSGLIPLFLLLWLAVCSSLPAEERQNKAQPATTPSEEPSAWTYQFRLPESLWETWSATHKKAKRAAKKPGSHIDIWIPPTSKRVRALLLIPNNTDSYLIGEHPAVRKIAAQHDLAIIHLKSFIGQVIEYVPETGPQIADESFQVMLEQAAQHTGFDDILYAPWITLGKSSRGRFPYHSAWWFPGRVIATISYHGQGPIFPRASWAKSSEQEHILHCSVNGLTEWDGTWFRGVRPGILNYQQHYGWLGHQAVIMGVDHGYYPDYYLYPTFRHPMLQKMPSAVPLARSSRVWDYLAAFMDAALTLRLPEELPPEPGYVTLKTIDSSEWLPGASRAIEEILGTKWFEFRRTADGTAFDTIKWDPRNPDIHEASRCTMTNRV